MDADTVQQCKRLLKEARERLFRPVGNELDVGEQLRTYSTFIDEWVRRAFEGSQAGSRSQASSFAVLATGGYGRQELFPYSDIDLCVLHRGPLAPEVADGIHEGFTFLWDAGLEPSHAVREWDTCPSAIDSDLTIATSLFEARPIAGNRRLFDAFQEEILTPALRKGASVRVEQRLTEIEKRHRFYGESPFVKEPNVKEGVGGLRDYHAVLWIERTLRQCDRLQANEPFPKRRATDQGDRLSFDEALKVLTTTRIALHLLAGRQQDHLDLASQLEVTEALAIEARDDHLPVEVFMRNYLLAALSVFDLFEAAVEEWRGLLPRPKRRVKPRVVSGFTVLENKVFAKDETLFAGERGVVKALEYFIVTQRRHIAPTRGALIHIAGARGQWAPEVTREEDVAKSLFSLFDGRGNVAATLRAMHRCGLLGFLIPEFDDLTGLVRFDPYHRYTVDEHSIRAVEFIDRLENGAIDDPYDQRMLERIPRVDLLKLALLLHDIGKSRGRGHVERGRILVPGILARLGVRTDDAKIVLFLVESHLLLADTLKRGDPSDPEVLAHLAKTVSNVARLHLLYLLTRADMDATSAAVSPRWKVSLLQALCRRTEAILRGHRDDLLSGEKETRDYILEGIADVETRARAAQHLGSVTPRYLMEVEPSDVRLHLSLVEALGPDRPVVVHACEEEDAASCWFVAEDRPGLLTNICGVFAKQRLEIVSADVYTRADGIALDRLRATALPGVDVRDEWLWREVEEEVTAAGRGELDLGTELANREPDFVPGPPRPNYPPSVHFDNRLTAKRTVIEVSGSDRRGLLFDLTRAMSERGVVIQFARIMTVDGRIDDTFYVQANGGELTEAQQLDLRQVLFEVLAPSN